MTMTINLLLILALQSAPFPSVVTDMEVGLYRYKAEVHSVYDGDTVRMDIDLGMETWRKNVPLRLYGINAPEMRGAEKEQGKSSRDFLRSTLAGAEIVIETINDKKGKYGRRLVSIWVKGRGFWCARDYWCNVNKYLVHKGHAEFRDY